MRENKFIQGVDYYLENGQIIYTEEYLKKRNYCCGNKCRHCVFIPKFIKGSTIIKEDKNNLENN